MRLISSSARLSMDRLCSFRDCELFPRSCWQSLASSSLRNCHLFFLGSQTLLLQLTQITPQSKRTGDMSYNDNDNYGSGKLPCNQSPTSVLLCLTEALSDPNQAAKTTTLMEAATDLEVMEYVPCRRALIGPGHASLSVEGLRPHWRL